MALKSHRAPLRATIPSRLAAQEAAAEAAAQEAVVREPSDQAELGTSREPV